MRKAVNIVGLELSVGFLHEFTGSQTKESLVYDLQEPFRWLGDDYRYHIEIDAKRRFLELLKDRFNLGLKYKGKIWKWDTVILNKTQELARFLLYKYKQIDFIEPRPSLQRIDTQDLRKRILELTQTEARKLGIGKSTLHYMRKNAERNQPFRIYEVITRRLMAFQKCGPETEEPQ